MPKRETKSKTSGGNSDSPNGERNSDFDACREVVAKAPHVDLSVTLLCAARYALGRKSYVPGCVISVLRKNPHVLNKYQKETLAKEIRIAHEQDKEWRDSKSGYVSPNPWEWEGWLALAEELESSVAKKPPGCHD